MPSTARSYGVDPDQLFNEDTNIMIGLRYLKQLLAFFGDRDLAIAAYNCGPEKIIKSGYQLPNIAETREFVRRVNHAQKRYLS